MPENTAPAGKSNVMSLYANEFDGGFKVVAIFLHFVAVKLLFNLVLFDIIARKKWSRL